MVVKRSNEKGVGLVLAMVILALLSMLVAAMLTAVNVELWIGDNYRKETQLVYVAEAGIEDGRELMRSTLLAPSTVPFIEERRLVDSAGREVGRYTVTLLGSEPLTL
ncbi:MAG TPA: pilus assembly PilX N-terminal domain-containing protein, partial [Terriglobia bacterium]|nr:pilus assembly PilX N-terminal domain-containing protein [Terriglobia bacterium]